jgi:nucleotide-binding universal stress UspA family protein
MHPAAVVGVDGLGGFAAMLLGAAGTDVIRTACVPVIVARQH